MCSSTSRGTRSPITSSDPGRRSRRSRRRLRRRRPARSSDLVANDVHHRDSALSGLENAQVRDVKHGSLSDDVLSSPPRPSRRDRIAATRRRGPVAATVCQVRVRPAIAPARPPQAALPQLRRETCPTPPLPARRTRSGRPRRGVRAPRGRARRVRPGRRAAPAATACSGPTGCRRCSTRGVGTGRAACSSRRARRPCRPRQRRVVEDRVDEVVDRAATAHDGLPDVHEIRCAGAEDVDAEDLAGLGVDDELEHPVAVADDLPARDLAVAGQPTS